MKKRFNLDFNLNSPEDRTAAVNSIISTLSPPPTPPELELFANYILFARDKNGESPVTRKEIEIPTKYSRRKAPTVSYEELISAPTFNEVSRIDPNRPRQKKPSTTFDRSSVPPNSDYHSSILPIWQAIDHISQIPEPSYFLTHLLIELRQSQFILKDYYDPSPPPSIPRTKYAPAPFELSPTLSIAPLGPISPHFRFRSNPKLPFPSPISTLPAPSHLTPSSSLPQISFLDPSHIYQIILLREHLTIDTQDFHPDSPLTSLLETLSFYISLAPLSPLQLTLLDLKSQRKTNREITSILSSLYSTSYSENYISTILTKQISPLIAKAAELHYKEYVALYTYSQSPTPEIHARLFKQCRDCGETYLRSSYNFTRRSRYYDNLNTICKTCESARRKLKKEQKTGVTL